MRDLPFDLLLPFSEVRLPLTQEEIDDRTPPALPFVITWFFGPMGGFCPCMFAADRARCLRRLYLVSPVRSRPRCRRTRRRHAARDPGGGDGDDDSDGGGDPPPPHRALRVHERCGGRP